MIDRIEKDSVFSLALIGNLKGRAGKVKVVARNSQGEASSEAELTVFGRRPTFVDMPIKCSISEGELLPNFT